MGKSSGERGSAVLSFFEVFCVMGWLGWFVILSGLVGLAGVGLLRSGEGWNALNRAVRLSF